MYKLFTTKYLSLFSFNRMQQTCQVFDSIFATKKKKINIFIHNIICTITITIYL